jgi:type IX secretion system PorP/SprF family membrane protein
MRNIKYILSLAVVCSFSIVIQAQQSTRISQYAFNPMLINSAALGNNGYLNFSTGFKSMWSGIPGAPKTQFLTVDGSILNKKVGLGLDLQNDESGLLKQKRILLNVAYKKRLAHKAVLSFGGGFGVRQHTYEGSLASFENKTDQAIPTSNINQLKPAINTGIYLQTRKSFVGLSAESVYQYTLDYTEEERDIQGNAISRFYLSAGRSFPLVGALEFRPMFLVKYEFNNPLQVDITPTFVYNQRLTFGASYRHNESLSFIIQNHITDQFSAGYAYDFQMNQLNSVSNGSHELMISYRINQEKSSFKNPRNF